MKRSLSQMSAKQLEKVLKAKQREEKAAPLVKKRAALLKAAEKLEKKIARILGREVATSTRGRRRGRKRGRKAKQGPGRPRKTSLSGRPPKAARRGRPPKAARRGRPPKKGKIGRPAKKVRKLSAAGRARIRAAVKARWAKVRAMKAKMAKRAKPVEAPPQESQATT